MSDSTLIIQEINLFEDYRPYYYIGQYTLLLYYWEYCGNVKVAFSGLVKEYFINSQNISVKTSKWNFRPSLR